MPYLVLVVSLIMVSIIFIWEISQELSEPYQSAVTKVITCKDAVGAFFIHPPAFEWNLATSSIRPVWSLLLVGFFFSTLFFLKRRYWKAQAKTKGWEKKEFVILCCEILYQFLTDCEYRTWRQASHKNEQKKRYTLDVYSFKPADWFFSQS